MRRDMVFVVLALQSTRQGQRLGSRVFWAAVTLAGGVGIALGASQSSAWGRALVVAFLLAAPARAILRLLPSLGAAAGLVVAIAGAVAINTLVALSMLSAHSWSPPAGVVVVGCISALIRLVPAPEFPDVEVNRCGQAIVNDHLISKGVKT